MMKSVLSLKIVIGKAQVTARENRRSSNSSAVLCNLTSRRRAILDSTRWAGDRGSIAQLNKTRDALEEAHGDSSSHLSMGKGTSFTIKAIEHDKMIRWIKKPVVMVQRQGRTLSHCVANLKMLTHGTEERSGSASHALRRCTLLEVLEKDQTKCLALCLRVGLQNQKIVMKKA